MKPRCRASQPAGAAVPNPAPFLGGGAGAVTSGCFSAELAGCRSRPRAVFMLITLQVFPLRFRNQRGESRGGRETRVSPASG